MTLRNTLLAEIEAYRKACGLSERRFGELAVGHHSFIDSLRRGACVLRRVEKAQAFMTKHPPSAVPFGEAASVQPEQGDDMRGVA